MQCGTVCNCKAIDDLVQGSSESLPKVSLGGGGCVNNGMLSQVNCYHALSGVTNVNFDAHHRCGLTAVK